MSNEIAKADAQTSLVSSLEKGYGAALPSHVMKEQFSRALLTQFRRIPRLMECTKESVASGVLTFAQLGLMVGVNGSGWLLPFRNRKTGKTDCVTVIGYQGLVDLCYRSDKVESICADVVCENDEFEFEQGLNQKLRHVPNLRGDRGEAYAVYAVASIKGSSRPVFVVLNRKEIMDVKASSPGSAGEDSPWNGNFEGEMWKKTAIKRLAKLMPKSVELQRALEFENSQAERVREVEANVIADDPLKPGRTQRRKIASSEPAPEVTPEVTPDVRCASWEDYQDALATNPDGVQKAIERAKKEYPKTCGNLSCVEDLDPMDQAQVSTVLGLVE